ncbi:MAG: DUF4249 domain-containing protein [Myxococcota bacterium]|nr:DUF4249 domain-containing protein [Myxococcota bacterium]
MRKSVGFLAVLVVGVGACTGARQLLAEQLMVATLLATPEVFISASAAAPDAGLPADAGYTVPAQTLAFVYFGVRDADALDQPPTAISDATITVRRDGAPELTLENQTQGRYGLTSAAQPELTYVSGATYEFRATADGEVYTAEVVEVPLQESIAAFHPAKGYVDHPAGSEFGFDRPEPPAQVARPLGFVTVLPLGASGETGQPTYTNIPDQPLEFLQLVARPANWKQTRVVVPGSAFPAADTDYLVVFQSAKLGGAKSDNLFLGSAIVAGTADVAVVHTR